MNKVEWCLKKAEKEISEYGKHRGLIMIKPDLIKARKHIIKAEHYLKASDYLQKGDFSDISASTLFYSMYHCLLSIIAKFGFESRNQECTFALVRSLIEDGRINLKMDVLDRISAADARSEEETILKIREQYQYGVSTSLKDNLYREMFNLAKDVLDKTKVVIE
jgi:uncharacterized protein (UPF0332 family)